MPGILCEHCTAACCRYIALPIDEPESREEIDDLRWYVLHEGVSVFVEEGDWYICVQTVCRHLQSDYRCGIYETRPRICRDYSTDNCDYHSGDYGWEHHFTAPEHLDEYARTHLNGKKCRRGGGKKSNGRAGRSKLRVRMPARRPRRTGARRAADAVADWRGVPLPVLGGLNPRPAGGSA